MQILATLASFSLAFMLFFQSSPAGVSTNQSAPVSVTQNSSATVQTGKQLLAVRGEVVKKAPYSKGWLRITIKPLKDPTEINVVARETDLIGSAVNRSGDKELLNLLSESSGEGETLTAAELDEGDFMSVIYDPQQQNRALEIYIH
jgi:hypothetical protein